LKYENGNLEAQWTNIKKYVLDTTSDLVVKVDRRARKPWITQYMISTLDEGRQERTKESHRCQKGIS